MISRPDQIKGLLTRAIVFELAELLWFGKLVEETLSHRKCL